MASGISKSIYLLKLSNEAVRLSFNALSKALKPVLNPVRKPGVNYSRDDEFPGDVISLDIWINLYFAMRALRISPPAQAPKAVPGSTNSSLAQNPSYISLSALYG
jgi:hypothetical protein